MIVTAGTLSSSYVYAYHGSATGLPTAPTTSLRSRANFVGDSDFNGDGYSDLMAWATSGRNVHGYRGSATGLVAGGGTLSDSSNPYYFMPIAGGRDLNGDGLDEIFVGDHPSSGLGGLGVVYIYYSSPSGNFYATPPTILRGSDFEAAGTSVVFGLSIG